MEVELEEHAAVDDLVGAAEALGDLASGRRWQSREPVVEFASDLARVTAVGEVEQVVGTEAIRWRAGVLPPTRGEQRRRG
jgi:hypothetical protein